LTSVELELEDDMAKFVYTEKQKPSALFKVNIKQLKAVLEMFGVF